MTISAARRDGTLVVEVADDGVGGASLNGGGWDFAACPTAWRRTAAACGSTARRAAGRA